MNILVSGSTGLVGSALVPFLTAHGHSVTRLARSPAPAGEQRVLWDPQTGIADVAALEAIDAVVHLAGESIASGRWTAAKKERIRASRVVGTGLLCAGLGKLSRPPRVLACASAIGFYGTRGDETLTEDSAAGTGFLADVCHDWEQATQPARDQGIRVVNLRSGVILSARGGALAKMLLPFKLGVGGIVGPGTQYMSWIDIDDMVAAIGHVLGTDALSGPVNFVAPQPVTNHEFTKTLGRVLSRPTILPLPAFAARLALGEMADELLLSSARVLPKKLQDSGYAFHFPSLEGSLRHLLG